MDDFLSFQAVGDVFASQLRRLREDVPMTASEMARRVTDLGVKMRRETVERIERGERKVQLDEAIACAAVLQMPPGVMFFGLGRFDTVGLSPEGAVHPDRWQQWLEGEDSAPGVDYTVKPFWKAQRTPIGMYQHLRMQQQQVRDLQRRIDIADRAGTTNADAVAGLLELCQEMVQTAEDMQAAGVRPPEWSPDFVAYVKRLRGENGV